MKIAIIGGGNMGGAIARGLINSKSFVPQDVTVIDTNEKTVASLKEFNKDMNVVIGQFDSLPAADIVIVALKPWLVEKVLKEQKDKLTREGQLIVSIAASVSIAQLQEWTSATRPIFKVVPNTAIALQQSMTFISSANASAEQEQVICDLFGALGKSMVIDEKFIPAATSLSSCGIAYAFRYIRAAMEGGVEMGFYPNQARDIITQTLRGAIELLETNDSHPEAEIDKVTTPGGITIKGLNEMEHAGFTSAVIRGLKASNVK